MDLVHVPHFEFPRAPMHSTLDHCLLVQAADLERVSHCGIPTGTHSLNRDPLILWTRCNYLTLAFPVVTVDLFLIPV